MKHIKIFLIIALLAAMIVPISGCGNSSNSGQASTNTQSEQVSTQKSENKLTEREQRLLDRLITMAKEDFSEPSEVRILEIPVYGGSGVDETSPEPERDDYASGSDKECYENEYVVVRLQGEKKGEEDTSSLYYGKILNPYCAICLSEANYQTTTSHSGYYDTDDRCRYSLKAGGRIYLGDDYKTQETFGITTTLWIGDPDGSLYFDIGKVNKALAAYWKDMGFE